MLKRDAEEGAGQREKKQLMEDEERERERAASAIKRENRRDDTDWDVIVARNAPY